MSFSDAADDKSYAVHPAGPGGGAHSSHKSISVSGPAFLEDYLTIGKKSQAQRTALAGQVPKGTMIYDRSIQGYDYWDGARWNTLVAVPTSTVDAGQPASLTLPKNKGTLLVGNGTQAVIKSAGANGLALVADSTQVDGFRYAAMPTGELPLFDVWCIGPQDVKGGAGAGVSVDINDYKVDKTGIPSNLAPLNFFNTTGSGLNLASGSWIVPATGDYLLMVDTVVDPRGPDDGISGPLVDIDNVRVVWAISPNGGDGAWNQAKSLVTELRLTAGQEVILRMGATATDGVDTEWVKWRVVRKYVPFPQ